MHKALGASAPARIHMLGRIGCGARVGPSPCFPADAHILT
ncbi:hypothetical protein ATPR_2993 [Acetobacter tropicalis NBRC 101654]|uniref:Uncharacterized protein n=1 Tax=Acetobacter tropicalis NBRC 101654 TaxID=749388 RepID=F7VHZ4_9PROT|nr:hypothetical protein ATPR_2993 [Acetobacter tropicalis NBRC 101654]